MNIQKEMKWVSLILNILLIALGILLIVQPTTSIINITYGIAAVLVMGGIFSIVRYFTYDVLDNYGRNDFMLGVLAILLGILLIWKTSLFVSIIPFIMGTVIMVSGFQKLQYGINAQRLNMKNGLWYIILAIINLVVGALIIWNPFATAVLLFMTIGVGLVYTGLSDLVASIYLMHQLKKAYKQI